MPRIPFRLIATFLVASLVLQTTSLFAQRKLPEGLLVTIPPSINPRDTHTLPMGLPDLEAPEYDPIYLSKKDTLAELGSRNVFHHDVFEYEFSFVGGLRQTVVKVPDLKTGTATEKNIWYIVYRIRDRGNTVTYEEVPQGTDSEHVLAELRKDVPIAAEKRFFLPQFYLEGYVIGRPEDGYQSVKYHDKIIPMALNQIQRRHDPDLKLLDSIAMSQASIPLAKTDADGGVWGVALFEDVDPRIDYVNLKVEGLTNAFRLNQDLSQPSLRKTLQINFWRPGGIADEEKDRIDYGIPLVDDPKKQVMIAERYHLPGPVISVYHINADAGDRRVLVAEVDAQINLTDFQSKLIPILEEGRLPKEVSDALRATGLDGTDTVILTEVVPTRRWSFEHDGNRYAVIVEPQYWEPIIEKNSRKIRFIKSLDYLWIYR